MKRLISLAAALALLFALCAPALAANTYTLDLSDVTIQQTTPVGIGRVVVEGDEAVPGMWARITISYIRADGTTWMQTVVYAVDLDGEFSMPYSEAGDTVTAVGVVILDQKETGPAWAGHNLVPAGVVS